MAFSQMDPEGKAWFRRMERTTMRHLGRFLSGAELAEIRSLADKYDLSVMSMLTWLIQAGLDARRQEQKASEPVGAS